MKSKLGICFIFLLALVWCPIKASATPPLTDEEVVLTKALTIRAQVLEKTTGMKFSHYPNARLEYLSVPDRNTAAIYNTETMEAWFAVSMWYDLNVKFKKSLSQQDPSVVANEENFQKIADHELGHAMVDQISRRTGNGPFFLLDRFYKSSSAEALGLDVLTEGTAVWFENKMHHNRDPVGDVDFPQSPSQGGYSYEMVAFQGGLWLVQDALDQYGESALIWMVAHPPVLDSSGNMRAQATGYRTEVLLAMATRTKAKH